MKKPGAAQAHRVSKIGIRKRRSGKAACARNYPNLISPFTPLARLWEE